MRISIIVAVADNGVIGRGGTLPWHLSADLQRFKRLTMGHTIIMGRRTWESIGRPLPGRHTVVVTRQSNYRVDAADVIIAATLDQSLHIADMSGEDEAFIVGGAELYREALPLANRVYFTRIRAEIDGDTRFPEISWNDWRLTASEEQSANEKNEHPFAFEIYDRN